MKRLILVFSFLIHCMLMGADSDSDPILVDGSDFSSAPSSHDPLIEYADKKCLSVNDWLKVGIYLSAAACPHLLNAILTYNPHLLNKAFYDGYNTNNSFNIDSQIRNNIPSGCYNCDLLFQLEEDKLYQGNANGIPCDLNTSQIEEYILADPDSDRSWENNPYYYYMDSIQFRPTKYLYYFNECNRNEQGLNSLAEALKGLCINNTTIAAAMSSLTILGVGFGPAFYEWWQKRPKICFNFWAKEPLKPNLLDEEDDEGL